MAIAQGLADRFGAQVTALFGVGPDDTPAAFAYSAGAALRYGEDGDRLGERERVRLRDLCGKRELECLVRSCWRLPPSRFRGGSGLCGPAHPRPARERGRGRRAAAKLRRILESAAQVHVAIWSRQPPVAPFSRLDVHGWLNRHGIASQVHERDPSTQVADELLLLAADLHADLLVMGVGYGHSRIREQLFGGVARARRWCCSPCPS